MLTCPNDDTADDVPGGLSYVMNSGYASMVNLNAYMSQIQGQVNPFESQMHHFVNIPADWDEDGPSPGGGAAPFQDPDDEAINRDSGVSWIQVRTDNFSQSLSTIYDGTSNTLLLAENINAGIMGTWSNPAPQNCTFVYPIVADDVTHLNFSNPPVPAGLDGLPNAMRFAGEGMPFPSSNHPGVVAFAFCDGGAKTLSDDIDRIVYLRLMTPAGTRKRFPGFLPEHVSSDNDF